MTQPLAERDLNSMFEHLVKVMASERFLNKSGLGKEVPFFICPFKPHLAVEMEKMRHSLIKTLAKKEIRVLDINLYDLSVELLKKRNLWQRILDIEISVQKELLLETLQGVLNAEKYLVPAIEEKMLENPSRIMFITGVGEVFPFIRSHNVLNNLQRIVKDIPLVMFFPGDYSYSPVEGSALALFGMQQDDRYYRAFDIFHFDM